MKIINTIEELKSLFEKGLIVMGRKEYDQNKTIEDQAPEGATHYMYSGNTHWIYFYEMK